MKKVVFGLAMALVAVGVFAGEESWWPPPRVIKPQGEIPVVRSDYFAAYHGDACDFEIESDTERINAFGKGLTEVKVADGVLRFKTGEKDNAFYFGRHNFPHDPDTMPDENIFFGFPRWGEGEIRMRVKQSLPESHWTISARRSESGGVPGKPLDIDVAVKGTEWQEVVIPFRKSRQAYRTLCFSTVEAGNEISIDSIQVNRLTTPVFCRKAFDLSAAPVYARFTVGLRTGYKVFVNGREAVSSVGYYVVRDYVSFDISEYLKKGRNIIEVSSDNTRHGRYLREAGLLSCKGLALLENGEFVSLNTDAEWTGAWQEKPDAETLPVVEDMGEKRIENGPVQYVGPLAVDIDGDPIFNVEQGIEIPLRLPKGHRVTYVLTNSFTRTNAGSGELRVRSKTNSIDEHIFSYSPDRPGVWELTLALVNGDGERTAWRTLEVAAVGRIEQKKVTGSSFTEGMKLKKVLSIDCAVDSAGKRFDMQARGSGPSERVNGAPGAYREGDDEMWAGFGYQFDVENLYRPHLIEVEYPDDKERHMLTCVYSIKDERKIADPGKFDWLRDERDKKRWHTGTLTGGYEFPTSDTFKKMYLIFWPCGTKDGNLVTFQTERRDQKAAAKSITVYEIDDLPALDVPDTPDRLFGMYIEREAITTEHFYTGEFSEYFLGRPDEVYKDQVGRLRDWYITYENLIKYLKFSGQNLYVPGYHMYEGMFFPETEGRGRLHNIPEDHLQLMAAMFEANGLYLMLGCEYIGTHAGANTKGPTNWEMKYEGADTVQAVSRAGTQSGVFYAKFLDFQHPIVDADIRACMDVFLKYARDFQCIKGVSFNTRNGHFPCISVQFAASEFLSSMDWGWQDTMVERFEKETGCRLPFDARDPERFEKRYQYVLNSPDIWSKWMDFRCRIVRDQIVDLTDHMRQTRPDWKSYVNQVNPYIEEKNLVEQGLLTYGEGIRRRGFDINLYATDEQVVNLPEVGRDTRGMRPVPGSEREQLWAYWGQPDAVYFTREGSAHTFDALPAEPYATWAYSLALARCTPSLFMFSQADNQPTSGGEQRFRPFLKAYRSLPVGEYVTLQGNGRDENIVIRALKGKPGCLYVVNPFRFGVSTTLTLASGSRFSDGVGGQPLQAKKGLLSLTLAPYEVAVLKGEGSIESAQTEAGGAAKEFVAGRVEVFRKFHALPVATARRLVKEWQIGLPHVETIEALDRIEGQYEEGKHLSALNEIDRAALRKLYDRAALYTALPKPAEARAAYRVACGMDVAYKDAKGNTWLPDQAYVFGVTPYGYVDPEGQHESLTAYRSGLEIAKTEDDELYRSERWGLAGYKFLVPDGRYTVKLHFAEGYGGAKRADYNVSFNIALEGEKVKEGFTIIHEAGFATAYVLTYNNIRVADGELFVEFDRPEYAKVMAIEVIKEE